MKRQSSLGGPAQSPPSRTERNGSEGGGGPGEAAMSLSMSPVSSSVTPLSTPLHSSVTHSGPASPFRLMREESVDGTLSPVSFKGGMDTLDNDTSGRRKVRLVIPPIQSLKNLVLWFCKKWVLCRVDCQTILRGDYFAEQDFLISKYFNRKRRVLKWGKTLNSAILKRSKEVS